MWPVIKSRDHGRIQNWIEKFEHWSQKKGDLLFQKPFSVILEYFTPYLSPLDFWNIAFGIWSLMNLILVLDWTQFLQAAQAVKIKFKQEKRSSISNMIFRTQFFKNQIHINRRSVNLFFTVQTVVPRQMAGNSRLRQASCWHGGDPVSPSVLLFFFLTLLQFVQHPLKDL